MKIYVDEMPKSWYECTFAEVKNGVGNGHWCMLRNGICPRLSEKTANEHKKLIKDLCPLNLLVTCPQIAEKEQEIERLKKEIKEPEEIWNAHLAELKEKVKQKLAQEFTEKINEMLKEKVEEKTIELNNQIRLMQESQQIVYDQMQSKINGYLKVIKAKKMMKNEEAIEQLEKAKEKILSYEEIYYQFLESGAKVPVVCLENFRVKQVIDNQINELKGKVEDVKD